MVPIFGPIIAEIVGVHIPNQKIDRIAKFARELEQRLNLVEKGRLESQTENEEFTDLIEEGIRQAGHSLSDERRIYIANIIANGLSLDEISYVESRHLLRMLGEINDIEVIWLSFYRERTESEEKAYKEKHNDVLNEVPAHLYSASEALNKYALHESYREHIKNLGMIEPRYLVDSKTKLPRFKLSGQIEEMGHHLTLLGRCLLEQMGIDQEEKTRKTEQGHIPPNPDPRLS